MGQENGPTTIGYQESNQSCIDVDQDSFAGMQFTSQPIFMIARCSTAPLDPENEATTLYGWKLQLFRVVCLKNCLGWVCVFESLIHEKGFSLTRSMRQQRAKSCSSPQ